MPEPNHDAAGPGSGPAGFTTRSLNDVMLGNIRNGPITLRIAAVLLIVRLTVVTLASDIEPADGFAALLSIGILFVLAWGVGKRSRISAVVALVYWILLTAGMAISTFIGMRKRDDDAESILTFVILVYMIVGLFIVTATVRAVFRYGKLAPEERAALHQP